MSRHMQRSCCAAVVQLPGTQLLFNDVPGNGAVIMHPRSRVVLRWVVFALLIAALAGLMAGSYLTSSELSSSVIVKRQYAVTRQDVQEWTAKKYSFTCPCQGLSQGTVEWAKVVPESVWLNLDLMKVPKKGTDDPEFQAFCVGNALLGGAGVGSDCKMVHFGDSMGFNTPDNRQDRSQILYQYPGSMLQAPACRSIAGSLHHLRFSGFPSPFLLSASGLQKTSQAALMGVIYSSASQVQSQMMTRWSFGDVAASGAPNTGDGFGRRLLQAPPEPSVTEDDNPQTSAPMPPPSEAVVKNAPAYGTFMPPPSDSGGVNAPAYQTSTPMPPPSDSGGVNAPAYQTSAPMPPPSDSGGVNAPAYQDASTQSPSAFDTAWNAFYPGTDHECNNNGSCANEACLLNWFAQYVNNITLDYGAYFSLCNPKVCDVVQPKSVVTRVVGFVSTLGGLWSPLFAVALLIWYLLCLLPALSPGDAAQQSTSKASFELF